MIVDEWQIQMTIALDHISAMSSRLNNKIGASLSISQLGNGASFDIASNLKGGQHKVSKGIGDW